MMADTTTFAHLEDGELLTLDDVESTNASSAAAREHLAGCARCAERLRVLRQHSRRISSLISELELPDDFRSPTLPVVPVVRDVRPWWTQPQWRRAAAVLFVIGSLAAVPQLRAWTVGWVKRQVAGLTGADRREPAPVTRPVAPTSQVPPIDSGATLWFDVDGPEVTVEFASQQASGTLMFVPSTRSLTGVDVVNGAGETPLVREHGVRLINGPSSTASYRLAVPASVQRIRVRVGDQPWQVFSRADVDGTRAVDLRQR